MSKLSVLNDAIEKLELAEIALGDARRAFPPGIEHDMLDGQFEVIGDAVGIVKKIMDHVERDLMRANK
jgi:hypothetical protein